MALPAIEELPQLLAVTGPVGIALIVVFRLFLSHLRWKEMQQMTNNERLAQSNELNSRTTSLQTESIARLRETTISLQTESIACLRETVAELKGVIENMKLQGTRK